jgi:hypothetical protein
MDGTCRPDLFPEPNIRRLYALFFTLYLAGALLECNNCGTILQLTKIKNQHSGDIT